MRDPSLRDGGLHAWKPRAPAPCNCHRIYEDRERIRFNRIPEGLEPGAWCACMCPVHENPEAPDGEDT